MKSSPEICGFIFAWNVIIVAIVKQCYSFAPCEIFADLCKTTRWVYFKVTPKISIHLLRLCSAVLFITYWCQSDVTAHVTIRIPNWFWSNQCGIVSNRIDELRMFHIEVLHAGMWNDNRLVAKWRRRISIVFDTPLRDDEKETRLGVQASQYHPTHSSASCHSHDATTFLLSTWNATHSRSRNELCRSIFWRIWIKLITARRSRFFLITFRRLSYHLTAAVDIC